MALIDAGDQLLASTLNRRVGTTVATAVSAGFTAETVTDSITVPLVSGRTYAITWWTNFQTTVSSDSARLRLREDNITGTALIATRFYLAFGGAAFGASIYAEYTAPSTASKTFVATGERASGTGTIVRQANATTPTYLLVELIG